MIQVSQAYRDAMNAPVRDVGYARITIGQFDNSGKLTMSSSDPIFYSDTSIITEGITVENSYSTWTGNGLRGDGRQRILPTSEFATQGFISSNVSDENGEFADKPFIIAEFSEYRTMIGLTLVFDDIAKEYPAQITVDTFKDDVPLNSQIITNLSPVSTPELYIEEATKIIIYFDKTREPFQAVTVSKLLFGIGFEYRNDDILSVEVVESSDSLSLALPSAKMTFKLKNLDRAFNPEINNSRMNFLASEQEVQCHIGQKTADGVDWVPGGTWYLKSWDTKGINATFVTGTIMDRLTEGTYEVDVWDSTSTLGDKIQAVIEASGVNPANFIFPDDVDTIPCPAPIEPMKCSEALQLLANFGGYQLRINRYGQLVFYRTSAEEDFIFTTDAESTDYSKWEDVGAGATEVYSTWETNFMRGDGVQRILPESEYLNNGWVSKLVAETDGDTVSILATTESGLTTSVYSILLNFGGRYPGKIAVFKNTGTVAEPVWVGTNVFYPSKNSERFGVFLEDIAQFRVDFLEPQAYPQRYHLADIKTSFAVGYDLTEDQIYYPTYSTNPARIARIQASYFRYTPSDEVEEIGSADVLENGEYRIEHDAATNITATIDYAGATVSITAYTHITIATVSGLPDTLSEDMNVRVTLNGNPIKATERLAERRLHETGDTLELKNPLYTESAAQLILDWAELYVYQSVQQEIDLRGAPEVEIGDYIHLDDGSIGFITKRTLKASGGTTDKFTVLRGDYSAVASSQN